MKLLVEYMGQLQSAVGRSQDRLELQPGETLSALIDRLGEMCGVEARPHLFTEAGHIQPCLLVALNGSVLTCRNAGNRELRDGDNIVFLPPIAGG